MSQSATRAVLANKGIVVTRPGWQGAALAQKLVALSARPIIFPALVILPPHDQCELHRIHSELAQYDYAVFVSANAVDYGLPPTIPESLKIIAPGEATAAALMARGVKAVLTPRISQDSEGLLALPELQMVAGQRFIIFRGETGREVLGDTLRERGAHVEYVIAYRRVATTSPPDVLIEAWRAKQIDAITLTNVDSFIHLWQLCTGEGQAYWRATPTFVTHARIAERLSQSGHHVLIVTEPGDAGLLAGLLHYFSKGSAHAD